MTLASGYGQGLSVTLTDAGGVKMMQQMHRQAAHLKFASHIRLAEIDDDESVGDYLNRLRVPEKLRVTPRGPLEIILDDIAPVSKH
ncbi:MAG: hypothetical protein OXG37_16550 [Actinomycetia bacterium]|nr:hypothetical protein [Actinomycetes bacterium]